MAQSERRKGRLGPTERFGAAGPHAASSSGGDGSTCPARPGGESAPARGGRPLGSGPAAGATGGRPWDSGGGRAPTSRAPRRWRGRGLAAASAANRKRRTAAGRRPETWPGASPPGACRGKARAAGPTPPSRGATSFFVPRSSGLIRRRGISPLHAIPIPGTVNREPRPRRDVSLPRGTVSDRLCRVGSISPAVGGPRLRGLPIRIPGTSHILVKSKLSPVDGGMSRTVGGPLRGMVSPRGGPVGCRRRGCVGSTS